MDEELVKQLNDSTGFYSGEIRYFLDMIDKLGYEVIKKCNDIEEKCNGKQNRG